MIGVWFESQAIDVKWLTLVKLICVWFTDFDFSVSSQHGYAWNLSVPEWRKSYVIAIAISNVRSVLRYLWIYDAFIFILIVLRDSFYFHLSIINNANINKSLSHAVSTQKVACTGSPARSVFCFGSACARPCWFLSISWCYPPYLRCRLLFTLSPSNFSITNDFHYTITSWHDRNI